MICPICNGDVYVIDTVHNEEQGELYRRRKCTGCGRMTYSIEYEVEWNDKFKKQWTKWHRCYADKRNVNN